MTGVGTAEVEAITPKVIAKILEESPKADMVFTQLFRENRDLERTRGQFIVIPKAKASLNVMSDLQPGESISPSTFSYEGVTIYPAKFGARLEVNTEALTSPSRDIIKDILQETALDWAEELEYRAQTVALDLKAGTITSWSGGTLGSTTLTPIVSIVSSELESGSVSSVDYYDGKVLLSTSISTGTVIFLYSNRCRESSLFIDAASPGSLTVNDILNLRGSLVANSLRPDVVIVHPIDLPDIFESATGNVFISLRQYSSRDNILKGEVGQIVDLRLLTSPYAPEGIAIVADSKRLGWDIIKRDLKASTELRPDKDQTWIHLWAEREFAVSEDNAIGILVNVKKGTYRAADL